MFRITSYYTGELLEGKKVSYLTYKDAAKALHKWVRQQIEDKAIFNILWLIHK